MENTSDSKKEILRSLLILKAQAKGTSYLEELRLLKEQFEEHEENKRIMDKDKSGDKDIVKMKMENESSQDRNEQTSKPDLPKKASVLTKLATARAWKKKAQEAKKLREEKPKQT
jgi:hypothetical protein